MDKLVIQVKRNKIWANNYNKKINLYKENNNWLNDDEKIKDFILGTGIAGVGQSYFPTERFDNIKQFLKDNISLIDTIKKQNSFSTESYKLFQDGMIKAGGGRKCWLAIHAMLCALNPELLSNIVDEDKLDELYKRLKEKKNEDSTEQIDHKNPSDQTGREGKNQKSATPQSKTSQQNVIESITLQLSKLRDEAFWTTKNDYSWYEKSHALKIFFNGFNSDHPWATLMALQGDDRVKNLAKRLKEQKNIILTGAPGTGKTYLAQQIAVELIKSELKNSNDPNGLIDFVQFHPSYDYSDFVEGLRPIMKGSTVAFRRMDGKFKAFCAKAANDKEKPYVFIIDEINRGEISKIFGELFFAIDPGYRNGGKNTTYVKTQYHQIIEKKMDDESKAKDYPFDKGFYVPDNVYIIGTMNDIDRSVDSMDFAFRRRFAFIDIKASDSEAILYNNDLKYSYYSYTLSDLITRMDSLNKAIVDPKKGGMSAEYQIGGAYFLKIKDVDYNYKRLWDEYIKGVLVEYYRGNPEQESILKLLEDAYNCTPDN